MPAPYSVFHRLVVSVSCSHMRCPVGALRTPQSDPAERDRSAASLGGEQQKPLAHSAKTHPPQSLLSERRTDPAEPPKIAAERDRTGASTGSDQTHPLAHSAKADPPPSFPACIGPVPRSPQKSQRSGIGPKQALEAIKPFPSRTARKPVLPRASLRAKVWSWACFEKMESKIEVSLGFAGWS
jgi:hypothetical protein